MTKSAKSAVAKTQPEESLARLESLQIGEPLHEHADEALRFIEQHQGFTYTPEQDKAVLRKIDRHLMPLVSRHPKETTHLFTNCSLSYSCHICFNTWIRASWRRVWSMVFEKTWVL